METLTIPELSGYWLHRVEESAGFEGVPVPGLSARFYRRDDGGRLASVGQYFYRGRELLRAWGYVDEYHCRFSAARGVDGGWGPAVACCPTVNLVRDGERGGCGRPCGPAGSRRRSLSMRSGIGQVQPWVEESGRSR